jgi:DNA polymerase III alpha subunit
LPGRRAVDVGQGAQRDRESGQRGLFDVLATPETVYVEEYPQVEEWAPKERLFGERDALGFYLTGHPLDRFQQDVEPAGLSPATWRCMPREGAAGHASHDGADGARIGRERNAGLH